MKSVGEILKLALIHVGNARPRHEVELLIAQALGISRLDLYLQIDRPVIESELSKIRPELLRLRKSEPFAYVYGKSFFFQDEFVVSKDVLIPRPETETLIEEVQKFLFTRNEPGVLFDLCTGSGCIGLTLKKLFPRWDIFLSDISAEALLVAKQNADILGLSIECLHGDLFAPFFEKKAHCIVANPPYLSAEEWEEADFSLREYEPKIALLAGNTGLEWYEQFFSTVQNFVYAEAVLFVEIGSTQAKSVATIAQKNGFFELSVIKDLAGHDRVIKVSSYAQFGEKVGSVVTQDPIEVF